MFKHQPLAPYETLITKAKAFYAKANNAYAFTIPVLGAGMLAQANEYNNQAEIKTLYTDAVAGLETALATEAMKDSRKAWLLGRLAQSAAQMNIQNKVSETTSAIDDLLKDASLDAYGTWAIGYIAGLDKAQCDAKKELCTQGAMALTEKYNSIELAGKEKDAARSDALWAWVMIVQAAAHAPDSALYEKCWQHITPLLDQGGIPIDDFNAWGSGILYFAAIKMEDKARFETIKHTFQNALEKTPSAEDRFLAELNQFLAHEHVEKLQADNAFKVKFG